MTTYDTDQAKAILDGLLQTPDAVPLEAPLSVGTILAMAEQVRAARAERDELQTRLAATRAQRDHAQARIQAIQATCWPLHRNPGPLGDFARTVLAEADPQPEHAA